MNKSKATSPMIRYCDNVLATFHASAVDKPANARAEALAVFNTFPSMTSTTTSQEADAAAAASMQPASKHADAWGQLEASDAIMTAAWGAADRQSAFCGEYVRMRRKRGYEVKLAERKS